MQRVTPDRSWPLYDTAATRSIERTAAAQLAQHVLMQRAGLAVARFAQAIAPHATTVWIACGPGNNGGDGLEAAVHLKRWGKHPVVTWLGNEAKAPTDAMLSLRRAQDAGVEFSEQPPPAWDLGIDALLGIGGTRRPEGRLLGAAEWLNRLSTPLLAVDIPSGLDADTGHGGAVRASHTLSLLALKPGLFTANGRDAAGEIWLDDLGISASLESATAVLHAPAPSRGRPHASHKGSYGDVAVIGGDTGMCGAVLLAGSAALGHGAGRVYVSALDPDFVSVDASRPELMMRRWESLALDAMSVVAGCGGGDAIRGPLPRLLATSKSLVLDADALNGIAADTQLQRLLEARGRRGKPTVITPHPLEAARLLDTDTPHVQAHRIKSAVVLAERFNCVVALKGSGTVVATPGRVPSINFTGNARLATAGTGDVLAGMIGARLAHGEDPFAATCCAVHVHGAAADSWPEGQTLTASALARSL